MGCGWCPSKNGNGPFELHLGAGTGTLLAMVKTSGKPNGPGSCIKNSSIGPIAQSLYRILCPPIYGRMPIILNVTVTHILGAPNSPK